MVILLLVAVALGGALVYVLVQKAKSTQPEQSGVELLKADVTELNRTITTLQTTLS